MKSLAPGTRKLSTSESEMNRAYSDIESYGEGKSEGSLYFLLQSKYTFHDSFVGKSKMLPINGHPRGPGGVRSCLGESSSADKTIVTTAIAT